MGAPDTWQASRWSDTVAMLGLYIFSFFAWLPDTRAYAGLVLIAFACILDGQRVWLAVRHSPLVWVSASGTAYILLRAVSSALAAPDVAHIHWNDAIRLSALCAFLLVAWSVAGNQRRILVALTLALAGFLIGRVDDLNLGRIEDPSWSAMAQWWQSRDPMGLGAVIALGQYSAASALGVLLMTSRLWDRVRMRRWRWVAMAAWGLLALLLIETAVISQSRGAWLAGTAVAIVLAGLHLPRLMKLERRHSLVLLALAITGLAILGYLNRGLLAPRIAEETDTYAQLWSGDFEQVAGTGDGNEIGSVGVRIQMLAFGLAHWRENPVLGLGPGATRPLIQAAGDVPLSQFPDLHNIYIEALLRLGLVGASLALACLWLTWTSGWRAYRNGLLDRDIFLVLTSAIALHLIAGLTNFRVLDPDWRFYWLLFGGAMASFAIYPRTPSR